MTNREIKVETFRSERAMNKGIRKRQAQGWIVDGPAAVSRRRRAWGLLLGIIGYWIIPPRREVTVNFYRAAR